MADIHELTPDNRGYLINSLKAGKIDVFQLRELWQNDTHTGELNDTERNELKRLTDMFLRLITERDCELCQMAGLCEYQQNRPAEPTGKAQRFVRHTADTKRAFVKWLASGELEMRDFNRVTRIVDDIWRARLAVCGLTQEDYITLQIIKLQGDLTTCKACQRVGVCNQKTTKKQPKNNRKQPKNNRKQPKNNQK